MVIGHPLFPFSGVFEFPFDAKDQFDMLFYAQFNYKAKITVCVYFKFLCIVNSCILLSSSSMFNNFPAF